MLRFAGAVLIITSASWLGIMYALKLKQRARTLRDLENALSVMQRELVEHLTPLEGVMRLLAGMHEGAVSLFFASIAVGLHRAAEAFEDIWRNALMTGSMALENEDIDALMPLAAVLGRYSAHQQGEAVAAVRQRLSLLAQQAEGNWARRSKLYMTFGLCAGFMIVILLV